MPENSVVRVENCPIKQEYCFASCYFRKGDRCCYNNEQGIKISELIKKAKKNIS